MATVSQTTFSSAFSWSKMFEFRMQFDWSLFLRVQLTISQHWFRQWLGAYQATSHYLNQSGLPYRRVYHCICVTRPQQVIGICLDLISPFGSGITEVYNIRHQESTTTLWCYINNITSDAWGPRLKWWGMSFQWLWWFCCTGILWYLSISLPHAIKGKSLKPENLYRNTYMHLWALIGSSYGLSPDGCQSIACTNAHLMNPREETSAILNQIKI